MDDSKHFYTTCKIYSDSASHLVTHYKSQKHKQNN